MSDDAMLFVVLIFLGLGYVAVFSWLLSCKKKENKKSTISQRAHAVPMSSWVEKVKEPNLEKGFIDQRAENEHAAMWMKKILASRLAVFIGIMLIITGNLVALVALAVMGALYEMVKAYAPDRCSKDLKRRGVRLVVLYMLFWVFSVVSSIMHLDITIRLVIMGILMCAMAIILVQYVMVANKYYKQYHQINVALTNDDKAVGTESYAHPCEGQCEDPDIILDKSPTPMYKHNCRAPCATATRSGRYYKGKRRK